MNITLNEINEITFQNNQKNYNQFCHSVLAVNKGQYVFLPLAKMLLSCLSSKPRAKKETLMAKTGRKTAKYTVRKATLKY